MPHFHLEDKQSSCRGGTVDSLLWWHCLKKDMQTKPLCWNDMIRTGPYNGQMIYTKEVISNNLYPASPCGSSTNVFATRWKGEWWSKE